MATSPIVEERHVVHHDESASSAGVVAIFLIAAVLIVGFLLFALNAFPFNATNPSTGTDIDVDLPDSTPNVNMEQNNATETAPGTTIGE